MLLLYKAEEVRSGDRRALERYHLSGEVLMENAGAGAARGICHAFPQARKIGILCGPGNNGGDGFVVARHLLSEGRSPRIILAAPPGNYQGEAKKNLKILRALEIPACQSSERTDQELREFLGTQHLLVDALLGTGTRGAPRGEVLRLLEILREFPELPLVALDIPSGIHPDSGALLGLPARATWTFTFLAPKTGLFVLPGAEYAGKVFTIPLGIPPERVLEKPAAACWLGEDTAKGLPRRFSSMHKGNRSTLLILGGSSSYRGAPALTALGALKCGAGVVALGVPENLASSCTSLLPEAVLEPLQGETLSPKNVASALHGWKDRVSCVVAGPGMGRSPESLEAIRFLWKEWEKPLLLDADALYALACRGENLSRRENAVLTPHEGEAARLLGTSSEEVRRHRLEAAEALGKRWGTVLLKGATTIISGGEFPLLTASGSSALAVPGSGDVLSGLLGNLLGSGLTPPEAAASGAWIHGMAGRIVEKTSGSEGVLASEIAGAVPEVLRELVSQTLKD